MPTPIENSEKFITGGVSGGAVTFGDVIKNLVLNFGDRIQNHHYYGRFHTENRIYNQFLLLDRTNAIKNLLLYFKKINCSHAHCPIITVKTANEHQPDWLFDRFVIEVKEEAKQEAFEDYTFDLNEKTDIKSLNNQICEKFKKTDLSTGNDFLKTLSDNSYYLFHVKIDVDNDDDKLHQFLDGFCDYWKEKPQNIKCLIFLSIKIREQIKPSIFKRIFGVKKPAKTFENMHLLEELEWVKKTDIERFFENHLKGFPGVENIKNQYSIQESWKIFAAEIDKMIASETKT